MNQHNKNTSKNIYTLNFVNTAINTLPLDIIKDNYTRKVKACYSLVNTTPVINPQLIHYSEEALNLLDLDTLETNKSDFVNFFSGNKTLPGSQPAAHCYCGHQFGYFSGQLGDGRVHYLGDIINNKGERLELQLKGSGKTPYSRNGDGRAVLRSSIREFLCSEAMHYLRVPTTRAATIITSDTYVDRDIKYDGHISRERATIISRIAPTFIRFGSFQIADPIYIDTKENGPSSDNPEIIKHLMNYVIKYHYSHIFNKYSSIEERIISFAEEIAFRTAKMVSLWQSYGFCNGVMNTDNMSILGFTIDYGPFGFMDIYDPDYTPNTSDKKGRYKFRNQPTICKWNLERLFYSISLCWPCIKNKLYNISNNFPQIYQNLYLDQMRLKLGLFKKSDNDEQIIMLLLDTMYKTSGDFTNIFRCLSELNILQDVREQPILTLILKETRKKIKNEEGLDMCDASSRNLWIKWLNLYKQRIQIEFHGINDINDINKLQVIRINTMNNNNPTYILRNHLVQEAIYKADIGDYSEVKNLLDILKDPFNKFGICRQTVYHNPPKDTIPLVLSCSS